MNRAHEAMRKSKKTFSSPAWSLLEQSETGNHASVPVRVFHTLPT